MYRTGFYYLEYLVSKSVHHAWDMGRSQDVRYSLHEISETARNVGEQQAEAKQKPRI